MNTRGLKRCWAILLLVLVIAAPALAKAILVQVAVNPNSATVGDASISTANSIYLTVLVTDKKGKGVSNLGASTGNGSAYIALPTGWSLSVVTVPFGGTSLRPSQFENLAAGVYRIRLAPFGGVWNSGTRTVVLGITGKNAGKTTIAITLP